MKICWLDFETRSDVPIRRGHYRYATGAEGLIATWAVDAGPVRAWDATLDQTPPADLVQALTEADEVWACNAAFDRHLYTKFPGLPKIALKKWRCLMVLAYLHGMPGKLEKLCDIFDVPEAFRKKDGMTYIKLFCVPKKDGTYNDRRSHPFDWECFVDYAEYDIHSMRYLHGKMPHWNSTPVEWHLWHLDQERNDRGFAVDLVLAETALAAVEAEKKRIGAMTTLMTDGDVLRPTQRDKLLVYLLAEHGVSLPDLKADTVERRLEDPELPDSVKELLRMRLNASKSSSGKYKRAIECHVKGRIHGAIQFAGAQRTARDAGRFLQPQNMARLDVDAVRKYHQIPAGQKVKEHHIDQYLDDCYDAVTEGYADVMLGEDTMCAASNLLRGVIVAGHGKKLVVADLSNIEGRMLAFLADEAWKLKAFADFDAGIGHDLYLLAYARSFATSPEGLSSDQRQIGKVQELALGYQGGVGAFAAMAATYGMDLDELGAKAWPTLSGEVIAESRSKRAWALKDPKRRKMVAAIPENTWLVLQSLVSLWRRAHPNTVQLWADVDQAAKVSVANPNQKFPAGRLAFSCRGNWLRMHLPSGRALCYPQPRISDSGELSYLGINQYTRQWARIKTYGGKLVENADQAASRDVFKSGERRACEADYGVVLVVHDELVCETPTSDGFSHEALSALMSANDPWNVGLPLSAKGWSGERYRKG